MFLWYVNLYRVVYVGAISRVTPIYIHIYFARYLCRKKYLWIERKLKAFVKRQDCVKIGPV